MRRCALFHELVNKGKNIEFITGDLMQTSYNENIPQTESELYRLLWREVYAFPILRCLFV